MRPAGRRRAIRVRLAIDEDLDLTPHRRRALLEI
jgi:hypothetical protein